MAANFGIALQQGVWGAKRRASLSGVEEGDRVWFLHDISSLTSPAPSGFPRVGSLEDLVPARLGRLVEATATSGTRFERDRVWADDAYPYRFHFTVTSDEPNVELRQGGHFNASTLDAFRQAATTAGFARSVSEEDASLTSQTTGDHELSLSTPYRRPTEGQKSKVRSPFDVDPNAVDRGLDAHKSLHNAVEDFAEQRGYLTRSPRGR
jgi:hypothetical protein